MTERTQRRLAAIVAADVVGYSRLIGIDEEGTLNALRAVRRDIVGPALATHGGRIANTAGDSLLLEFPSVVDAVRCALAVQQAMAEHHAGVPEDRQIKFRVGINVGDVVADGDDLLGDGVNVAARLENLAEPGGIALSDDAYRHVRDRLDMAWQDAGEHALKNIARSIQVWHWSTHKNPSVEKAAAPGVPALPDTPSIAVLPFANRSSDPDQEFFADGVTDDIVTALSKLRGFFVIARNTTMAYKGEAINPRDLARDLGVRYVLHGSVRAAGNRVRVASQLTDALNGTELWADRYDRAMDDVFAIQDEITQAVVGNIEPELYAAEHARVRQKPPQNLDAWECFIRGVFEYSKHTNESTKEAADLLARAVQLDSNYAQAYGLGAVNLAWRAFQGWEDPETAFAAATRAAQQAILCDPQEPWAYMANGFVNVAGRQNAKSVAAFQNAIDISPNVAYAHGLLGASHALGGRPDIALECIDRAMRLSPRDIFGEEYHLYYAFTHFQAGRYTEAAVAAEQAIELRPAHPVLYIMATASHGLAGAADRGQTTAATLTALVPDLSVAGVEQTFIYVDPADNARLAKGLRQAGLPE